MDDFFEFIFDLLFEHVLHWKEKRGWAIGCLASLVLVAVYAGLAVGIWWFFNLGFLWGPIAWLASCVAVTVLTSAITKPRGGTQEG